MGTTCAIEYLPGTFSASSPPDYAITQAEVSAAGGGGSLPDGMDTWSICVLADGQVGGSGYQYEVKAADNSGYDCAFVCGGASLAQKSANVRAKARRATSLANQSANATAKAAKVTSVVKQRADFRAKAKTACPAEST